MLGAGDQGGHVVRSALIDLINSGVEAGLGGVSGTGRRHEGHRQGDAVGEGLIHRHGHQAAADWGQLIGCRRVARLAHRDLAKIASTTFFIQRDQEITLAPDKMDRTGRGLGRRRFQEGIAAARFLGDRRGRQIGGVIVGADEQLRRVVAADEEIVVCGFRRYDESAHPRAEVVAVAVGGVEAGEKPDFQRRVGVGGSAGQCGHWSAANTGVHLPFDASGHEFQGHKGL